LDLFKRYIGDLFFAGRIYLYAGLCALLFIISFFVASLQVLALVVFLLFLTIISADYFILFILNGRPWARRTMSARLSNGDENEVRVQVKNPFNMPMNLMLVDELPFQLQERNFNIHKKFKGRQQLTFHYKITPLERGEYDFGNIILFFASDLGMFNRRFIIPAQKTVSVYPSFMQMRQYQLVSKTTNTGEHGNQRMRKIGQSMEFEQIKDYVTGDDIRSINWKATARRGGLLMVNNYVDEKSQQVYCIIDKGRLMKMPFNGLSLLDYAINATLALSNVCLQKQDRVGLLSFSNKLTTLIAADRKPVQRENILKALYKEQTAFLESDYEMLYTQIRHKIKQRSLLVLYTNFESVSGLRRQVNYLRSIARHHLLMVIFFENTELNKLAHADAISLEDVYVKTVAEKFMYEKKLVVKELQKYGILTVLTTPQNLTINSINKYLELKARQAV
jgi:uncharacterized protein (DUF58 family)